jgi:hypothetical protein
MTVSPTAATAARPVPHMIRKNPRCFTTTILPDHGTGAGPAPDLGINVPPWPPGGTYHAWVGRRAASSTYFGTLTGGTFSSDDLRRLNRGGCGLTTASLTPSVSLTPSDLLTPFVPLTTWMDVKYGFMIGVAGRGSGGGRAEAVGGTEAAARSVSGQTGQSAPPQL